MGAAVKVSSECKFGFEGLQIGIDIVFLWFLDGGRGYSKQPIRQHNSRS